MPVISLPFLLATAFLSLHVGARSAPDAGVFRRVERSGLHTRDPLFNSTCQHIRNFVSNESAVYAPGSPEYDKDMGTPRLLFLAFCISAHPPHSTEHWATSSSEFAACSVEPGNVQDLSIVVRAPRFAAASSLCLRV